MSDADNSDFGNALSELLGGFSARIEAERRETVSYQTLLAEDGLIRMLRRADHQMTGIALDVAAVLRDKYDIHLDRPTWQKVIGLSAWANELAATYRTDQLAGSVDRAWQHIARELRGQGA